MRISYRSMIGTLVLCSFFCLPAGSSGRAVAQSTDPGTINPMISNTLGFGVAGGYHICNEVNLGAPYLIVMSRIRLGAVLGLEGAIGYRGRQKFTFTSPTGEDYSANVHTIPVTGSMLLIIPLAPSFTPYLVGGVGLHYVILDYSNAINQTIGDKSRARFGYHLGFGLEIPLNNHVAFLGDYRYQFVTNAFEDELFDFSRTRYRSNSIAAGVVVYF